MKHDRFSFFLLILLVVGLLLTSCAPQTQGDGSPAGGGAKNQQQSKLQVTASPFQPRGNGQQPADTKPTLFKGPLSVLITTIGDNTIVKQNTIEIGGTADDGTVISINDTIASVGKSRQFNVKIQLDEGLNVLEITASDPQGNQGTVYLTVTYDPNA